MAEICGLQIIRTYCEIQKRCFKEKYKNNTTSIYLYMYELSMSGIYTKIIVVDVL